MSELSEAERAALIEAAREVRANAYAPYSHYQVGAAAIAEDGSVHVGTNVENASYPHGICAEQNALGTMIAAGRTQPRAIAVATKLSPEGQPGSPCGGCRQFMSELGEGDLEILLTGPDADSPVERYTLQELLPERFSKGGVRKP